MRGRQSPYWRSSLTLESRVQLTLHARFGKGSTEKVLATGTSPAIYFTGMSGSAGGRRKRGSPDVSVGG